jgi:hypothetical protein
VKDIPEGWVAISKYDTRPPGTDSVGPSGDYARLLKALRLKPCPIRHYRDGRGWVANQSDIEKFLAARRPAGTPCKTTDVSSQAPTQCSDGQFETAVIALCEINNGITLIHATLERLATAVESIATQPRRDPLEQFANDNGFHDTLSRPAH